ncbi:MAG: IS66 family transposase [Nitrososphaera sp.]
MPRGILTTEDRLRIQVTRLTNENRKHKETISGLQSLVQTLQERVHELELKLEDKELQRKEAVARLYKPNHKEDGTKPLGKKPGSQAYHRAKPKDEEVTEELRFTPTRCPYCKRRDGLGEATETIVKYTEDIVILPEKIVKKYLITKHRCSYCKEDVRSDKVPLHIPRIGMNAMGYVLYARYRLRLPYNKIQQSLKDLHTFHISEGEIALLLTRAEELFGKDHQAIIELIKISDKVYCDETGWRVKGKNFWIWVFVTSQGVRYMVEDTRGGGIPKEALGEKEDRVIISDFYSAYGSIPGENQYCWVHLLRDSLATESTFHTGLQSIYHALKQELEKPKEKRNRKRLDKLLEDISQKTYTDANSERVAKLQERIRKRKNELLTCMKYDTVLPENNTAERALRNHVVMRKIFGGSRSLEAARAMAVNTSVIDTLMLQNPQKSFFDFELRNSCYNDSNLGLVDHRSQKTVKMLQHNDSQEIFTENVF